MKHLFDVDVAKDYGINAAILLENIAFWCVKNEANGANFHEGRYWTYNSRRAFNELFPYMSERQIATALKKLEDSKLIVTGNFNKSAYDRTMWYALGDNVKSILHFCTMDNTKMSNGNAENVRPIPDINTDGKPNNKPYKYGLYTDSPDGEPKKEKKPVRNKYGEYQNILLSDDELAKWKEECPDEWQRRIDDMSNYLAAHGKQYKDYLAALRTWYRKDKPKKPEPKVYEERLW